MYKYRIELSIFVVSLIYIVTILLTLSGHIPVYVIPIVYLPLIGVLLWLLHLLGKNSPVLYQRARTFQSIDNPPAEGVPFIGYNPHWVDQDFNPKGIRECHRYDGDMYLSAVWFNEQDCWVKSRVKPTHWMPYPNVVFQNKD